MVLRYCVVSIVGLGEEGVEGEVGTWVERGWEQGKLEDKGKGNILGGRLWMLLIYCELLEFRVSVKLPFVAGSCSF